jgi:hypothetical protein
MRNNSCYTLTVTDILVFIVVKHIVGHLVQRMKLTAFEKSSLWPNPSRCAIRGPALYVPLLNNRYHVLLVYISAHFSRRISSKQNTSFASPTSFILAVNIYLDTVDHNKRSLLHHELQQDLQHLSIQDRQVDPTPPSQEPKPSASSQMVESGDLVESSKKTWRNWSPLRSSVC